MLHKNTIIFIVIIFCLFLLSGCGVVEDILKNSSLENSQNVQNLQNLQNSQNLQSDDMLQDITYISTDTLDYETINKLDNETIAWSFGSVSDRADELCENYEGFYRYKDNEKFLYLTFDEGYENGYTSKILDVLKENDVKAAFFITGPYLESEEDLVKRMVLEGHTVGNHTWTHPSMPEVASSALAEDITKLSEKFTELTGAKMEFIRPPKGEFSERTIALSEALGYKTIFWSFAYADWDPNNQKGTEYAFDKITSRVKSGDIILLHAVSKDNANVLDRIIKYYKDLGYTFKSLK